MLDNVFGEFLLKKGLYSKIEITEENLENFKELVGGRMKLDVYCPMCKANRVFSGESIKSYEYDDIKHKFYENDLEYDIENFQQLCNQKKNIMSPDEYSWKWISDVDKDIYRLLTFKFRCSMDAMHHLDYVVIMNGNMMVKIGQYPSFADLSFPELKEYKNVLDDENERELKRAIGLYASGIGIGSFVYLRRIFERIIKMASEEAIKNAEIDVNEFNQAHVDKKIRMLERHLPKGFVENKVFYSIVSKGIHELSEDECIEFFPILKSYILMILRQWDSIRRDKEEEKEIRKKLGEIAGKYN